MAHPQGGFGGGDRNEGYGGQGYGGQGYGVPAYGGPGYGGPGSGGPVEHPQGTTVLILGICGIVVCQILAPIAWSMGTKALAEIDRDPLRYSNRSNVNTGRILGMIGTIILGVSLVFLALYVLFAIAVIGGSASTS